MRLLATLPLVVAFGTSFAQPGPCTGLEACFVPNALMSGNYIFDNCSSNQNSGQFTWDFGDGSAPSFALLGEHTYLQPGTYQVCLTANWGNCVDTSCTIIVVQGGDPCLQLQADFGAFTQGSVIEFVNSTFGTGSQTQYVWNFGDGTSSTQEDPVHTYAQPGVYQVCLVAVSEFGILGGSIACTDEYCTQVTIGVDQPCTPGFVVAMAWNAGPNGQVFFTATSSVQNTNFIWYFGDGIQETGPTTIHHYTNSGTYGVCVTGWYYNPNTLDTCWVEDCETVIVDGAPCDGKEACFTIGSQQQPNAFYFTNCSTPEVNVQYVWDFGDGTFSNNENAEHVFSSPGVYQVCLSAFWANCEQSFCQTVVVPDVLCGGLMANFGTVISGNLAEFGNATTGNSPFTTWSWTFGDGATSNAISPSHTYALPGIYQVCLTAASISTDPNGVPTTCVDTYCLTITTFGGTACQLVADFFYTTGANGVQFTNNSTGLGQQTGYSWDFGDGSFSDEAGPFHTYQGPGTYQACLWVNTAIQGPNGTLTCQDSICTTIVIDNNPCLWLQACFTALPFQSGAYLFENCTESSAGIPVASFWDFGDGSTSNEGSPSHTFLPGSYTVCLIATQGNCVDSTCTSVVVGNSDPCLLLNAAFTPFASGLGVNFSNATSGTGATSSFAWQFGDGATSNDPQPYHLYSEAGTYEVCLVVVSIYPGGNGQLVTCTDEHCDNITVGSEPCEQLQAGFVSTPNGLAIQFASTTSGASPQSTFTWTFGDGSTGSGPNPLHDYAVQGVYEACLYVESIYAFPGQPVHICADEICYTVDVGFGDPCTGLVACFEALPFENGAYLFDNCSQLLPIDIPATYLWSFGDGATSIEAGPTHAFTSGVWTVCLTVTHGTCVDQYCTTITVFEPNDPCTGLSAGFSTFQTPNGVQFSNTTGGTGLQTTFLWSFGDGTSSTQEQPFHSYPFSGTYEVCLSATSIYQGSDGQLITCTDEHCGIVIVDQGGNGCDPNYFVNFTWTDQGNVVVFSADASAPTIGYVWDFGDGTQGDGQTITHLYEPPGPYEVCVSAWYWNQATNDTCWTSLCQLVDPFNIVNGVADIAEDDITVFPIPARDMITVSGLPASATLRLFAADGRLVLNERAASTAHQLDVVELASGTYILRIDAGDHAMYRRVAVE